MFKETLVPIEALRSSIGRLGLGSPTTWAPERVGFNLRLVARDLGLPEEAPERPSPERVDQLLALAGLGPASAMATFGAGKPSQERIDYLLAMIPEGRAAIRMRNENKGK